MLQKIVLTGIGAALGLGVTMSSVAQDLFQATAVVDRVDISEMVMIADDGSKYRLSPELVPEFRQQQSSGQIKKSTLVRISGQYGRTEEGAREPFIERMQPISR